MYTFSFQSSAYKWINSDKFQLNIIGIKCNPFAIDKLLYLYRVFLKQTQNCYVFNIKITSGKLRIR